MENLLLHRIVLHLDTNNFEIEIRTYEAKIIPSGYMVWLLDKAGNRELYESGRRISNVIGKNTVNKNDIFSFFGSVYCFEQDLESCKESLIKETNISMLNYLSVFEEVKTKVLTNFNKGI